MTSLLGSVISLTHRSPAVSKFMQSDGEYDNYNDSEKMNRVCD
ncbi:hypothetical protein COO91_03668 [Nostoc flagelliforme CCNUN1]|uniref:Uncharacterized protein n=1 Tax=Nostoc flagelliforme CCNUN1 TaxID=2038116 RepID=A0A2K8SQM1_9NOSO|nr:hypothetical protein COO91_03668 [Nostoc flagelliforme CCNUN1]